MPYYAELISQKAGNAVQNVWGFIDGTLRRTCRPSRFQKLAYSGHKRCHGIKFQAVHAPDGLIVNLYGPIAGSRHDSFMLGKSQLLPKLRTLMPIEAQAFSLYGDPAYPQSAYLFGGFRNPNANSPESHWNTTMSRVREAVEWCFKDIIKQWSFLDYKQSMQIFKFPVGEYFVVAAFLTNIRTCIYGNETMHYFKAVTPTVQEYLAFNEV
jgi:hypothetical protein